MSEVWGAWGRLRREFWSSPSLWPNDSSDYVFLGRAVQRLGRVLYGDQWTGEEPATPWDWPLPDLEDPSITEDDVKRAQWLLLLLHDGYRARVISRLLMPVPTREEWLFARNQSLKDHEANWSAYSRFQTVKTELCTLFEAGRLPTGIRNEEGGEITPIDRSYWNAESVGARFVACRIHPALPFSWSPALEGTLLLFVARTPLEALLAKLRPALAAPSGMTVSPDSSRHWSIYLRFMVEQAERLDLTPETEPKHEELVSELREAWGSREPPLSNKLLRAMATLMRSSDAQKGRGRKARHG